MESQHFGVHEITDMRELINFKAACLVEAKSRLQQAENVELKMIIEQGIRQGTETINEMKTFLSTAATQMKQ